MISVLSSGFEDALWMGLQDDSFTGLSLAVRAKHTSINKNEFKFNKKFIMEKGKKVRKNIL